MSLDNIQMPAVIVQDLYKRSLVSLDVATVPDNLSPAQGIPFLGKHKKLISIIVESEGSVYLPDNDLHFLLGILGACKLTMEDVSIINKSSYPELSYEGIQGELKPSKILFFGIEPNALQFPLQFPQYKIQAYNNQSYLTAASLSVLASDKEQKLKLWNCLKILFEIP